MIALTPALRTYDWGTQGDIPALLGIAPSAEPVAEAWWGSHPLAPATATNGHDTALDALITHDRQAMLGPDIADRWDTLPYLLKVLSIRKPLSIQVHPSLSQARAGFAREEAAGVPLTAPDRFFKDASHKPELVVALTPMVLLAGFRPFEETAEDLRHIGGQAVALAETLTACESYDDYVHAALSLNNCDDIMADLAEAASRDGAHAALVAAARAAQAHPGDSGALLALAMNVVALEPGTAMFTGAGIVHSYQSGMGVEIMANSDNVVRAGLTTKSIDVELLLELAITTPSAPSFVEPTDHEAARIYSPGVEEFELAVVSGGHTTVPAAPRIVVAVEGQATVASSEHKRTLEQGQAVFVPHGDGSISVTADSMAVVATVPSDP